MLKKEVREWVKYLVGERKSFKVVFANDKVEIVEYKGYCWVLSGKAYSGSELIEKMVRFQQNAKKFIIKFEMIEEVEEVEVEPVEEVEHIPFSEYVEFDGEEEDLFTEHDLEYSQYAIEREDTETSELVDSINQELLKTEILASELVHEVFDTNTDNSYVKYIRNICKCNRCILTRTCKYIAKLEKYFKEDFTGLNWMTLDVDTGELEFYYTLEEVSKSFKKIG